MKLYELEKLTQSERGITRDNVPPEIVLKLIVVAKAVEDNLHKLGRCLMENVDDNNEAWDLYGELNKAIASLEEE